MITLLIQLLLFFFISGFMEGYWKRKNTANHWLSIIQTVLFMTIIYTITNYLFLEWYNILAVPFLRKVPFDYGYMYGAKSDKLLGTTSWDDIILNKLSKKFNIPLDVLIMLIIFMTGVSLLLI